MKIINLILFAMMTHLNISIDSALEEMIRILLNNLVSHCGLMPK